MTGDKDETIRAYCCGSKVSNPLIKVLIFSRVSLFNSTLSLDLGKEVLEGKSIISCCGNLYPSTLYSSTLTFTSCLKLNMPRRYSPASCWLYFLDLTLTWVPCPICSCSFLSKGDIATLSFPC